MSKYTYLCNQLTIMDYNEKPIVFVLDMSVGLKSLINELEYHGIYKKDI